MLVHIGRSVESALAGDARSALVAFLLVFALAFYSVSAVRLWRIDVASHRLPDRIVLPLYLGVGLPLFAVVLLTEDADGPRRIAYSGVMLLGSYYLLRAVSRRALGLGDVKLAGALGLLLGYFSLLNLLWGTLLTFVLGGVYSLWLLLRHQASPKTHIPFGPFMLLGTLIATIFPA
ncbi:prepilin peptidase [Rothia sp. ZJ932]|uniref:prepilin peptidase n=1 Tax=Rothia sp. ZJ932 TaxID=2810516 RepID=UPI001967380F|nr:prepilin peptidase [Rothia sp. ZJ932]QRZ61232.1 prepilin peptidase [Rothia sp. ZJ932]